MKLAAHSHSLRQGSRDSEADSRLHIGELLLTEAARAIHTPYASTSSCKYKSDILQHVRSPRVPCNIE